jgi:translation initiation factor 1
MLAGHFADELKEAAAEAASTAAESEKNAGTTSPAPRRGTLRVELDKHGRKGKPVTLVTEFQGDEAELARLTKLLQSRIGAGGSHCFNSEDPYDGQILIQGDCRSKVAALLQQEGYKVRLIN